MGIDLWHILKRKFPSGQYALMKEVRDKAGHEASRSADYMAVGLWPSRGLAINGIEVKSHRNDWLNELKNPAKAENIYQYCDYWWLLTTDDKVAYHQEIPENWGWMYLKGSVLKIAKEAPKLNPVPPSKDILATMLKRCESKDGFILKADIEHELKAAKETGRNEYKSIKEHAEQELERLRDEIQQFKEASGIDLRGFKRWKTDTKKIGEAVAFISEGRHTDIKEELLELQKTTCDILNKINSGIDALNIKPENKD